jgi:hypothetical protein
MRSPTRVFLVTCAVAAAAIAAAACGGDDGAESNSTASQESIDTLSARVARNEQMFALITLDTLGLHDMDEGLNETGEIESSYVPNTREAARLLALTDWGEFQDEAGEVLRDAERLLAALRDSDVDAAKAAATELHESQHQFSGTLWDEITKDLSPAQGGPQGGGHEGGETPAAEETPDGGASSDGGDHEESEPTAEATH